MRFRRSLPLTVTAMLGLAVLVAPVVASSPGQVGSRLPAPGPRQFDIEAHRGGLGLVTENTLDSFANGLELGVTTLELDVQITEDQEVVVTHDRQVSDLKCNDTAPASPGDPEFPYVGDFIKDLTLEQVWTLDCGQPLPDFPDQRVVEGARLPLLSEVFDLVGCYGANQVWFNIETKVEAGAPEQTAPREQFVQLTLAEIREADVLNRVTIQSFDWGTLMRWQQVEPRLPLVALTNRDFLEIDEPGASPWLGGLDIDDFDDSLVAAAAHIGVAAISPVHGFPQNGKVTDPGYEPYTTAALVTEAHAAGLAVVPWTIDDVATMESLIDAGVDGLITDYPDRLRDLLADRGYKLPRPVDAPAGADCVDEASAT